LWEPEYLLNYYEFRKRWIKR